MNFINGPEPWSKPLTKWWDQNLSYEALSQPAFDDEYTSEVFDGYQAELDHLTDEGKFHGNKLRIVSMRASEVRKKVEELCNEMWGHALSIEGVCTNCGFIDDRTFDEAAEDFTEMQVDRERE